MSNSSSESQDELSGSELESVFGREDDDVGAAGLRLKRNFLPWHRPVKQVVRSEQWGALAAKLVRESGLKELRYLTLPGEDLFDVRVIAEVCAEEGCKLEYLGFDSSRPSELFPRTEGSEDISRDTAGSVLRQQGLVTDASITLSDCLEDIVIPGSQAAAILRQFGSFDVINIDACDHLASEAEGDRPSLFGAVGEIFAHQRGRHAPWLLYITTRVSPDRLGRPKNEFVDAINRNLELPTDVFRDAFAEAMGVDISEVGRVLGSGWNVHDDRMLRLFSIGLGKYLLQLAHGHYGDPAKVELASCYCYRVHEDNADMLALAFRVRPSQKPKGQPTIGGKVLHVPMLEPALAAKVARRTLSLADLDRALDDEEDLAVKAMAATKRLLKLGNYDLDEYAVWLQSNARPKPMRKELAGAE